MRERPILFSGPMVRAILAGNKTQTRRVAKPVRHPDLGNVYTPGALVLEREPQHVIDRACPYGQPGDRLWVRETWAQNWDQLSDTRMDRSYVYRADGEARALDNGVELPWRPSIHMPRSACRLVLEITSVRVERLQAISYEDALAEGAFDPRMFVGDEWNDADGESADELARRLQWPQRAFRELWCGINGAESWDANPWVWVVEFRRIEEGGAHG